MALGVMLGTDLLSQFLSSADSKAQEELEQEAMRLYGDISPPTLELLLQQKLGPSAMERLPKDFGNKANRNAALERMLEIGLSGGMDPESQLAVEQARRAGAATSAQGQGAVLQEFQRRGMGGAGEAALALQAQQAGADRASMGGMQAAADARSRALQALSEGGGMAAGAEAQDFGQAARVAESMDAINRFNSELASGAIQQDWQNRLGLADRRYTATRGYADFRGGKADAARKRVGAYGQAANETLGNIGSAMGGFGGAPVMRGQPVGQSVPVDPNDPRFRRGK